MDQVKHEVNHFTPGEDGASLFCYGHSQVLHS